MSIELIKKDERFRDTSAFRFGFWPMLFTGIFLFVLLGYGGLLWYKIDLERNLSNLDGKIDELSKNRDIPLEQQIEKLDNQISGLNSILTKHLYWSRFFSDLEKLALAQAYFNTFGGKINSGGDGTFNIKIQTTDYSKAAAQIKILEQYPYFKNVDIGGIGAEEGAVNFSADITFDPVLLLGNKSE